MSATTRTPITRPAAGSNNLKRAEIYLENAERLKKEAEDIKDRKITDEQIKEQILDVIADLNFTESCFSALYWDGTMRTILIMPTENELLQDRGYKIAMTPQERTTFREKGGEIKSRRLEVLELAVELTGWGVKNGFIA